MVVESLTAVEKLVEVELLTSVDFGADSDSDWQLKQRLSGKARHFGDSDSDWQLQLLQSPLSGSAKHFGADSDLDWQLQLSNLLARALYFDLYLRCALPIQVPCRSCLD